MATNATNAQDVLGEAVAVAAAKQLDQDFDLERWAQEAFNDEPFTKLVALVGLGAALFYKAEVGNNPKVTSYWDALVYISTCCSVGYGDIFAHTPIGKAIGSIVMTIGPAMANAAFDGSARARAKEAEESQRLQQELLATMKEILAELRSRSS
jgi:hypothetical protein